MQKPVMATLAAIFVSGCAGGISPNSTHVYDYTSKAHSGNVLVTDARVAGDNYCNEDWREGDQHTPDGLHGFTNAYLAVTVDLVAGHEPSTAQSFAIDVPKNLGSKVVAKDYQNWKGYILAPESHGIVVQGDYMEHPSGYYLRVSKPSIAGDTYKACVGLDHMYVLEDDLYGGSEPQIYLDRVTVPFAMEGTQNAVKVSFGSKINHAVEIRVRPK